jgi:uncharacterized protein YecE (DUF72 family)
MSREGSGARIRVGVAGWDYPDWAGTVYPSDARRGFDRLAYLSRYVDLIEINSTFYRPNLPRSARSWLERTRERPGFRFAAKSHRSWTHHLDSDPRAVVPPTLDGLFPLHEAGALSALLVQFPQSFHERPRARERIEALHEQAEGWPLVIEVRHASWDTDEAAEWMRERGIGWCVVDQPRVGRSTAPARARVTSKVAYLRLHGRNVADWFRPDAGRDARYDYLYSSAELEPLADACREMAGAAEELVVVQNNHFRGQAVVNAIQLKHLLGERRPEAPPELARTYPEIERFARMRRDRLF